MINILPLEEKKKNLTEYRFRLGIIGVFAVAALVVASLILLAPAYFLAVAKNNTTAGELSTLKSKQGQEGQEKDINAQILDVNKKINLFLEGSTTPDIIPSLLITRIIAIKSEAIKIQGFTYDLSGGQDRMVITGVALDRDSLSSFVEALKKEPTFAKVDLPISSYVKSANISFSIAVERGNKK